MLKAYICSPYRARTEAELDRNIEYAQEITRRALLAGVAPITPHLYITQCLNDDKKEEREVGITAGMEILKGCDFVIAGIKYGISAGMSREITLADAAGIDVVNADKLALYLRYRKNRRVCNKAYRKRSYEDLRRYYESVCYRNSEEIKRKPLRYGNTAGAKLYSFLTYKRV